MAWNLVLADLFLAALFGGMVFFPAVVAPTVFRVLPGDQASRFLRALFPLYYAYVAATAAGAALMLLKRPLEVFGLGVIVVTTVLVRQTLVPKINAWRDAALAGDERAESLFNISHRFTVLLNVVQMLIALTVIVRL